MLLYIFDRDLKVMNEMLYGYLHNDYVSIYIIEKFYILNIKYKSLSNTSPKFKISSLKPGNSPFGDE